MTETLRNINTPLPLSGSGVIKINGAEERCLFSPFSSLGLDLLTKDNGKPSTAATHNCMVRLCLKVNSSVKVAGPGRLEDLPSPV